MKWLSAAALALALCSPPLAPLEAAAASAAGEEAAQREYWQERAREVHEGFRRAEARYQAAITVYEEMRIRRRPRGEKKAAAIAELEEAKAAFEAARSALEAFPEQARRGGALPGWIRLPSEPDPAAPTP